MLGGGGRILVVLGEYFLICVYALNELIVLEVSGV